MAEHVAKHLREVFAGGNWTCSNLRDQLADVTWQEAVAVRGSFNSIAVLTFHIGYYLTAAIEVLEGCELTANDKYAFTPPPVSWNADWEALRGQTVRNGFSLAALVEKLPDEKLQEVFSAEKYGTYYRNLHGIIEHTHYHLGQIAFLKKMLREAGAGSLNQPAS